MKSFCIYCGKREATEKDHVPPQCFFSSPKPSNLITVPSCSKCNRELGKIDERVRNLLTSLDATEQHPAIISHLANKRNRSMERRKSHLRHMLDSIRIVDVYSKAGIFLGKAKAFNLNQPAMNKFFDRMARALLFHENSIGHIECKTEWRMSPNLADFVQNPDRLQDFLSYMKIRTLGDDIFSYAAGFMPKKVESIWILNFYGGIEFIVLLKQKTKSVK